MNAAFSLSLRMALSGAVLSTVLLTGAAPAAAGEPLMFGYTPSRNMVDPVSKNLPSSFDVDTGMNVKWSEPVGSQSYAGPVIQGNLLLIGTNNEGERDEKIQGDKGVVMAFEVDSGKFLWQIVHDKLPEAKLHDWPLQGVCSTPIIEGDIAYYTSNRAEVVAIDLAGLANGNQGMTDETYKDDKKGDILWSLDMMAELDVFPHNLATSSPLIVGDLVYVSTGNGVDEGHINVPSPFAPSFLAVNKKTGEVAWENADPGENILHGTWTNPTYGEIGGVPQVLFPGGDGVLYSFEPKTGKLLWTFDCNPKDSVWRLGGAGTRNNLIGTPVVYDGLIYIAVGQDPEHGEGPGNFWVIDATVKPDENGEIAQDKAVWHRGGEDFNRTISTAAIHDGIVYATDLSGFLYALDAKTGEHFWTYDAFAAVWGSPFVADGKIYLGDEDGDIAILKAGKKMEVLAEANVGSAVYTTPVAHDGVLYVLSRNRLFAFAEGIKGKTDDADQPAR
ncbi:MAG: PQQ-binding-like beta-propeller repeat protein [Acidobacteriota bacterium]